MKSDVRTMPVPVADSSELQEEVRKRAYQLFEARGREGGHELEDWLQAEAEIQGGKTNALAA